MACARNVQMPIVLAFVGAPRTGKTLLAKSESFAHYQTFEAHWSRELDPEEMLLAGKKVIFTMNNVSELHPRWVDRVCVWYIFRYDAVVPGFAVDTSQLPQGDYVVHKTSQWYNCFPLRTPTATESKHQETSAKPNSSKRLKKHTHEAVAPIRIRARFACSHASPAVATTPGNLDFLVLAASCPLPLRAAVELLTPHLSRCDAFPMDTFDSPEEAASYNVQCVLEKIVGGFRRPCSCDLIRVLWDYREQTNTDLERANEVWDITATNTCSCSTTQ